MIAVSLYSLSAVRVWISVQEDHESTWLPTFPTYVQMVIADNEFNKVKDHVPHVNMNTLAAAEHIGKIERCIQVFKERSRGIICTLPYPKLPQMMLVHLLHFIVMRLNNFPPAMGISSQWSPMEIILCHHLDYKHHCCTPFGAHCEVHEDHEHQRNSMKTPATFRAHTIFQALSLALLSNAVNGMNFLHHNLSLIAFPPLPRSVGCLKTLYLPIATVSISTGPIMTSLHWTPPLLGHILISLPRCRECRWIFQLRG